ncbi:putative FAD dependent oxidoreductase domain-containing protein [Seiridium cardinale]|uniref:FAD dependent oxidoreductase domain-containing protein n=1 Tax=Seiridium cardinale TaxID=138064 RepID=A0ABR2XE53_9PEZI
MTFSEFTKLADSVRDALVADPGLPRPGSTISQWLLPPHPTIAEIQSATLPSKTDILVIGSGITGCSVARNILEEPALSSAHVTVLDARSICSGATGRNGGNLVSTAGHTFEALCARHGEENAKQIARFSISNIDNMLDMIESMDSDLQDFCQIRRLPKIIAAGDEKTWSTFQSSVPVFKERVPEHKDLHAFVTKETAAETYNIRDSHGAILFRAGAVWPYRLITGIFERLLRQYPGRLSIEANTPVLNVSETEIGPDATGDDNDSHKYPYTVMTARGRILASKVVYCTNAYTSHLLPNLRGKIFPFRGTMSRQQEGPESPRHVGSLVNWSIKAKPTLNLESGEFFTGLHYVQQNARTGHFWAGTENSTLLQCLTPDDTQVPPSSIRNLCDFLPRAFVKGCWPEVVDPEKASTDEKAFWSGIQGHTADELPLVGKLPPAVVSRSSADDEWIAAGFGGYGMDKCWAIGEAVVKMMVGKEPDTLFPKCYQLTEERLQKMSTEDVIQGYLAAAVDKYSAN